MLQMIYTLSFYLMQPFIVLRLLWRSVKAPAYNKRIAERYGFFVPPLKQKSIWIHSVSMGETIASAPLVRELMRRYPRYRIIITTMTPTGSSQVEKLYSNDVFHVYAPYDLPGAIKRFLKKTTPSLAVFMETELWPNTISACKNMGIPVMIANARLSERSAGGYHRISRLTGNMLAQIHTLAAQYKSDGDRFLSLGLNKEKLHTTGSLKYDMELPERLLERGKILRNTWLKSKTEETRIIIAVSTHRGEEEQLLSAFKQLNQKITNTLFVIVPRHPERFNEVFSLCGKNNFSTVRRSRNDPVLADTEIMLADTMGEMLLLLSASDIVYMGGSLVKVGGHNFLEPAALALPQISGPNVFNFQHIADTLQKAGGLIITDTSEQIADTLMKLLADSHLCNTMGAAAATVVQQEKGALKKHLDLIERIIPLDQLESSD